MTDERVLATFGVSCATGEGIADFKRRLFALVPERPFEPAAEDELADELADFLVYRPKPKRPSWHLLRTDRGYRVAGTPPSPDELERALRAAGARSGAVVELAEESFELAP